VFNNIFAELARKGSKPSLLMIDATHLKAHRTAVSLSKKGTVPRRIGRTKGGLNSKLHAVCDGRGHPIVMLLSEGQMSDYKGAALMINALPPAKVGGEDDHMVEDTGVMRGRNWPVYDRTSVERANVLTHRFDPPRARITASFMTTS
jgi:hypothetical protein